MDKIWDRKFFKVGGHWPLWRGMKKPNDHAEPTKSRTIKKSTGRSNCLKSNLVFQYMYLTVFKQLRYKYNCYIDISFTI